MALGPCYTAAILIFFTAFVVANVSAFSSGAGACSTMQTSVSDVHLVQPTVIQGNLQQGNFVVLLDGKPLAVGTPTDVTINESHTLTLVTQAQNGFFRGLLFRLGDPTGVTPTNDSLIVPDGVTNVQVAAVCSALSVAGITHVDATDKTNGTALLQMTSAASGLTLDVNVVVQNRNSISEFYYDFFTVNAVTSASAATAAPSAPVATTSAPVPSSTSTPTLAPSATSTTAAAPTTAAPVTTTPAPSQATSTPSASPIVSTTSPVATTAAPVQSTFAPSASPIASTRAPVATTPAPTVTTLNPTPAPTLLTAAPVASTLVPTAMTVAPIAPTTVATTPTPTTSTSKAPTAITVAPIAVTPAPSAITAAPVASTLAPVASTPAPVATTPAPVALTPAPVTTTTLAPSQATSIPALTAAPIASTPAPVATTTLAPSQATSTPMAATAFSDAPVASTLAPIAPSTYSSAPLPAPFPPSLVYSGGSSKKGKKYSNSKKSNRAGWETEWDGGDRKAKKGKKRGLRQEKRRLGHTHNIFKR